MKRAGRFDDLCYGPDDQQAKAISASPDVFIGNRGARANGLDAEILFHLHLDADRDGVVDWEHRYNDRWDWTREGFGAIVLPNLTPDKPRRAEEIVPLVIQRDPKTKGRSVAGWRGELVVENPYKLHILSGCSPDAKVLVDGERGPCLALDLRQDVIELGMEATQHPGPWLGRGRDPDPRGKDPAFRFNGQIKLFLRLYAPDGDPRFPTYEETALVQVAPWIMFNHFDPTLTVYVSEAPLGEDIRAKLSELQAGVAIRPLPLKNNNDVWSQDQGELGFASTPACGGDVEHRPELVALKGDILRDAVVNEIPTIDANLPAVFANYGGNLECTPPFVHEDTGRVYAYGRIYYGHQVDDKEHPTTRLPMQTSFRLFLNDQAVQDPFSMDTGWLAVGHVDEVVACLPMKDARLGFRVLLPSPRLALELVEHISDEIPIFAQHADRMGSEIVDIYIRNKYPKKMGEWASQAEIDEQSALGESFRLNVGFLKGRTNFNLEPYDFYDNTPLVEHKMQRIRDRFKREVGLCDDDFIRLPVLFATGTKKGQPMNAVAFTPNVVNGLVITQGEATWSAQRQIVFLAPKPFGPAVQAGGKPLAPRNDCIFEEYIRRVLGPPEKTGVEVRFADVFQGYHRVGGEVHCGTNSLRKPPIDRVWWAPRQDTRRKEKP